MYHSADGLMRSTDSRSGFDTVRSLGIGQRLGLLWLVGALLFQGFVIQTHAHFGANRTSAIARPAAIAPVAAERNNQAPIAPVCPLCEEKAKT